MTTVDLRPLPVTAAPARRLPQLFGGLVLYGTSMAMQLRATLGLDPWDVFHQGVARHLPVTFGTVVAITGVAVLLLWIPLRQRPGIGTVANVIVIAVSVDVALALIAEPTGLPARIALLVAGIVLNGVASAAYIGARLGPGPRDGLMTGLAARTGWSIRLVRTSIRSLGLRTHGRRRIASPPSCPVRMSASARRCSSSPRSSTCTTNVHGELGSSSS